MRHQFAAAVIALSVLPGIARAQTGVAPAQSPVAPVPAPVAVNALGPQPGARVPVFSATDQNGRTQSLESLLGPKGAMLVFSRSADW